MLQPANISNRLALALSILRYTIFITMAMWTMDKFVRPEHAAAIFEHFYGLAGLGINLVYALATAEAILLIAFLIGLKPRFTYGAVLILHGVSTLASYQQYINPFDANNLLFFAAWPMLGASFTLYILRDFDIWRIATCCGFCKNKTE
ncbi:MAG: hypothetical protein CVU29_11165 [Betaproteobacteria bacterium HGW-Betaproteobacteria-22]|nr:MAG: hypothetical protein CVU29_11165 [Betaproteobacteria bacterium HGW-Betaproteobacteria-22]